MAKTLSSQHRAPGCSPWLGNRIPHAAMKIWCSQINKKERKKRKQERRCISVFPKLAHVECSWKVAGGGGEDQKNKKPELISVQDLEFRNLKFLT